MSWPIERVDKLRGLLANGYSASQAAAEMGCSRNAIMGVAHRKCLVFKGAYVSWRPKVASKRSTRPRRKTPFRPPVRRLTNYAGRLNIVEVKAPPPLPPEEITETPVEQRRSLLELKKHHCRWPNGDVGAADFYFCGGQAIEGKPYCLHHCRISYRRPGQVEAAA